MYIEHLRHQLWSHRNRQNFTVKLKVSSLQTFVSHHLHHIERKFGILILHIGYTFHVNSGCGKSEMEHQRKKKGNRHDMWKAISVYILGNNVRVVAILLYSHTKYFSLDWSRHSSLTLKWNNQKKQKKKKKRNEIRRNTTKCTYLYQYQNQQYNSRAFRLINAGLSLICHMHVMMWHWRELASSQRYTHTWRTQQSKRVEPPPPPKKKQKLNIPCNEWEKKKKTK